MFYKTSFTHLVFSPGIFEYKAALRPLKTPFAFSLFSPNFRFYFAIREHVCTVKILRNNILSYHAFIDLALSQKALSVMTEQQMNSKCM